MSRSSEGIVLTLLGGAVLGGLAYSVSDDRQDSASSQREPCVRNQYANMDDCGCAYSQWQCDYDSATHRWVGPWYREYAQQRNAGDPGPGSRCDSAISGYGDGTSRAPIGLEHGFCSTRGGFGSRSGGYMG